MVTLGISALRPVLVLAGLAALGAAEHTAPSGGRAISSTPTPAPDTAVFALRGERREAEEELPPFADAVADDLGLSPPQRARIGELTGLVRTYPDGNAVLEDRRRTRLAVLAALSPRQRQRLESLKLQFDGPLRSLLRGSVQSSLGLRASQAVHIEALFSELAKVAHSNPGNRHADARSRRLLDRYDALALASLTEAQRRQFDALRGRRMSPSPPHWWRWLP